MNRRRLLFIGVVSLAVGSLLSSVVYRSLQRGMTPEKPEVSVVVAARNLMPGQKIEERDLKVVRYPGDFLPADVLHSEVGAVGNWAGVPMTQGDFVTSSKLADVEGLPSLIPVGMRAAPVSVNDVVSVAGFAKPGTLVDVLATGRAADSRKLQTITVLQRVRVLAAGSQMEKGSVRDAREARVVTLLVTPEEAGKLTLAAQEGHIQLIIRNPRDTDQEKRPPVRDPYESTPGKKRVQVKYVPPAPRPDYEVQLLRGERSENVKLKP